MCLFLWVCFSVKLLTFASWRFFSPLSSVITSPVLASIEFVAMVTIVADL